MTKDCTLQKQHSNIPKVLCLLIVLTCMLVVAGCSDNNAEKASSAPPTYNIGFTQEQFQEKFNIAAKNLDMNIKISSYRIDEKDGYQMISAGISDNVGLSATVNKSDHTIRSLTLLATPDGSSQHAFQVLSCMAILMDMITPNMMPEDRGNILKDLEFNEKMPDKSHTQTTRGDIRYTLDFVKGTGIQLIAINKNDK